MSRGGSSLHSGVSEELRVINRLKTLRYRGFPIVAGNSAGGGHGVDITTTIDGKSVGFEVGTKGKFEGGGCTLYIKEGRLNVPESKPLLQELMGNYLPWSGVIPPLTEICKDDHKDVPSDSVARYYASKGAHYILLNGDIYHTGDDVLNIGVPMFKADMFLRTRITKHMKNGKPTDYTTALVFSKTSLPKTEYSLFGKLPADFTEGESQPQLMA